MIISKIIQDCCNKLRINYRSPNLLSGEDEDVKILEECLSSIEFIAYKLSLIENDHPKINIFKNKVIETVDTLNILAREIEEEIILLEESKQNDKM